MAPVQSVKEFLERVIEIKKQLGLSKQGEVYDPWFRGQSKSSWNLCPKLYRPQFGGSSEILKGSVESELREEFIRRAPILCEHVPHGDGDDQKAEWEWYFIMQHHTAPTRLLDWTEGALIALHFAVKHNTGDENAAVWVLDPYKLNKSVIGIEEVILPCGPGVPKKLARQAKRWLPFRQANLRSLPPEAIAIDPIHVIRRLSSQHSCFTVHGKDERSLDRLLASRKPYLVKMDIPRGSIPQIKKDLRLCGIDECTVFPDLDGLSRAISARWEVDPVKPIPHGGVYARLGPSKIHGVGVFAIRQIPKGTNIFPEDTGKLIWKKKSQLKLSALPAEVRKLYNQFCLIKDKGQTYGCPESFNLMTIAWYLNHSKTPNVGCDEDYNFVALKEIKEGEELTADYHTYNEFADPNWV